MSVLNRNLSRGEVVQIVTRATRVFREREYYRNNLTKAVWEGKKADVVWLFVFPSLEDEKNNNWLCRSQWVDIDLEDRFRPASMLGVSIGEDLVIDWSENYQTMASWRSSIVVTKEEYLLQVDKILPNIMEYADKAAQLTEKYQKNEVVTDQYVKQMRGVQGKINALYTEGITIDDAPLECKDFSVKFQALIALADNITLPFSEVGLNTWTGNNRNTLIQSAIKSYTQLMGEINYEYRKIQ